MKKSILFLAMIGLLIGCDSKPKVIVADTMSTETQQPVVDESANKLHKVVVEEILNTTKYTYLNVSEEGQMTWIAIPKKEIEIGGTYYYRGGLKKTNFKSLEHDKVFETLYLVSDVSKEPEMTNSQEGNPHGAANNTPSLEQDTKLDPPVGGLSIAELLTNRKKYDGQTVKVRGKCVKLNNMIMKRNWIHLQDGSLQDKTTDLTVTTTESIPLGAIVAFEGKIALNKDFGAGYKYEIIMEEATIIK